MITIKDIKRIAKRKGWKVEVDESDIYFSKYTPEGQDFSFNISIDENKDGSDIVAEIKEYADNYDPDYEAYLWIGNDGHGKGGAPYHIKDIVTDMEKAQKMVYNLHKVLLEYSRKHSE